MVSTPAWGDAQVSALDDDEVRRIRNDFPVETAKEPTIVVSQATLPSEPKVLVLPGN